MFLRAVKGSKTVALMAITRDIAINLTEREMKFIAKFEGLGCEVLIEPKKEKKRRAARWFTDARM